MVWFDPREFVNHKRKISSSAIDRLFASIDIDDEYLRYLANSLHNTFICLCVLYSGSTYVQDFFAALFSIVQFSTITQLFNTKALFSN